MKDDAISRQAAIDALTRTMVSIPTAGGKDLMDDVNRIRAEDISVIKRLPSAQPERKMGKWIIKDNPGTGWYRVTCSECGEDVTSTAPCIGFYPNAKVTWDYCPNCGADMRGEADE